MNINQVLKDKRKNNKVFNQDDISCLGFLMVKMIGFSITAEKL
jgi:hypothetical protein